MDATLDNIIREILRDLDAGSLDDSVEAARAPQMLAKREAEAATAALDAEKTPPPFRISDKAVVSAMGREWMFRDLRLHIKLLTRQVTNTLLGDKSPHKDDVLLKLMGDVNHMQRIMEIRNAIADFAQPERMRLRKAVLAAKRKPAAKHDAAQPQRPQGASTSSVARASWPVSALAASQSNSIGKMPMPLAADPDMPTPAQIAADPELAAMFADRDRKIAMQQEWVKKMEERLDRGDPSEPVPEFPAELYVELVKAAKVSPQAANFKALVDAAMIRRKQQQEDMQQEASGGRPVITAA